MQQGAGGAPRASRTEWAAAVLIAGAAVLLYLPTLSHEYVLDDVYVVEENPVVVRGLMRDALLAPYWPERSGRSVGASNWRPLTTLSLVAERRASPLRPERIHHAINVALHGLLVLVLFPLARRLAGSGWPALAACAVFAVHPAHVESVAPIVGRADLIAALGGLASLECFLRYRDAEREAARAWPWLSAAAFAYAAGLAGKETAAPFLALLPASDLWLRGTSFASLLGRRARAYVPFVLVAIGYLAMRIVVLGGAALVHRQAGGYGAVERLLFACKNAVLSAGLLLAPIRTHHLLTTLPSDAPFTYPLPAGAVALAFAVGGLAIYGGWLILACRSGKGAFLWLAGLLPWLPTSGLLPAAAGVALRFLLLPSAFAACAVGWGLARLAEHDRRRARVGAALVCSLVLVAGVLTARRIPDWADNGTFYASVLREQPNTYTALYGLGHFEMRRHPPAIERARALFREAIRVAGDAPVSLYARLNLGLSYQNPAPGEDRASPAALDTAREIYEELIEIAPDHFEPHFTLAILLETQGRPGEALAHYERVLALNPEHPRADTIYLKIADERVRRGEKVEAMRSYRSFLERFPGHPETRRVRRALRAAER